MGNVLNLGVAVSSTKFGHFQFQGKEVKDCSSRPLSLVYSILK